MCLNQTNDPSARALGEANNSLITVTLLLFMSFYSAFYLGKDISARRKSSSRVEVFSQPLAVLEKEHSEN